MRPAPRSAGATSGSALERWVAAYGLKRSETYERAAPLVPEEPLSQLDWESLIKAARQERLLGLLASAVLEGSMPTNIDQSHEVHKAHVEQLCGDLILERQLIEVARLLSHAGLGHRVLKGAAVAHLDYPDPGLRSFADIDVLVPAEQWDDAIAVLDKGGWKRQFAEPRPGFDRRFIKGVVLIRPGEDNGRELDLHRTLALGPFGLTVRLADLWEGHASLTIGGEELRAVRAEERFLHACFHAALGDLPPRLVPLRDVAQMSLGGKLDFDRVVELSRAWGAEAVLVRAVDLAWETLSLDYSAEPVIRTRSLKPNHREIKALNFYLSPRRSYVGLCLAAVRVIRRPSDKIRYLTALAFPRSQFVGPRYSSRFARWRAAAKELRARRNHNPADIR